jgi:hypothetical protein
MSARSEPTPLSWLFMTVSVLGSQRSSSASRRGRKRGAMGPFWRAPCGARVDVRFRSQEKNDMMFVLSGIGFKSPLCIPMRIRPAVFLTTEQKKEKN